jgi:hypothetical protein
VRGTAQRFLFLTRAQVDAARAGYRNCRDVSANGADGFQEVEDNLQR